MLIFLFPGFHLMLPLITKYEPIQVTIQTDQVINTRSCYNLEK